MMWRPSRRDAFGAALALGVGSVVGCSPPILGGTDGGGDDMAQGDVLPRDPLDLLVPGAPMQLAQDGQLVAALGFGEVIFWDTTTGGISSRTVYQSDVSDFARHAPWSWRGPVLALSERWGEVTANLVETSTGTPIAKVRVGRGDGVVAPWALALSPDGSLLASSLEDGTIRVHSTANGKELRRVEPRDAETSESGDHVPDPSYTHDGSLVLSSGFVQCPVQFWEGDGSRLIQLMPQPPEPYYHFQLTPDSAYCSMFRDVNESGDAMVTELRDGNTSELIASHPIATVPGSAALHPQGTHVAWTGVRGPGLENGIIHVMDFDTGEVSQLGGDAYRPHSLAYTPDGTTLLSMDARDGIHAWDHATASLRQVFESPA